MQFPAKLAQVYNEASLTTPKTIVVNNLNNNPTELNTDQQYYVIADKTGTATVFKIYWHTGDAWVQHGNNWYKESRTGWWAVDSSYSDNDSRAKYLGSDPVRGG